MPHGRATLRRTRCCCCAAMCVVQLQRRKVCGDAAIMQTRAPSMHRSKVGLPVACLKSMQRACNGEAMQACSHASADAGLRPTHNSSAACFGPDPIACDPSIDNGSQRRGLMWLLPRCCCRCSSCVCVCPKCLLFLAGVGESPMVKPTSNMVGDASRRLRGQRVVQHVAAVAVLRYVAALVPEVDCTVVLNLSVIPFSCDTGVKR